MNALSAVSSWLTTQNVFGDYNKSQVKADSKTQESNDPNSFFSILKLLDTNADEKIGSDELKFGAGFMINSLVSSRDMNMDLLLTAEEAGVPQGVINALDTDADQKLGAGEMIAPADKIIDGLVSILDTDGDKALSRGELAIVDLLFSLMPSADSEQTSDSGSVTQAFDLNTIPDRMRQAGFEGTDNQLYYALASTYAEMPWQADPTDPALVKLSDQRENIYSWFDKIVTNVSQKLEANPDLTMNAIMNDGPDRCGFRLGLAIMKKLNNFGDRVQMGTAYEGTG
jgi:hypothetical protein